MEDIEKLAMISIYDSRITYCAMEIQRLAVILRDSFIEL